MDSSKNLRKDKYDIVFDVSLGYLASLLLSIFVRIPIKVGFNYRDRGKFLTHKFELKGFNEKHVIEYYLDLLSAVGVTSSDKEMELYISEDNKLWADKFLKDNGVSGSDKMCAVIPGCGVSWGKDAGYRRWSSWKFAEVADHLSKVHKYKILIFGEESEAEICSAVAVQMKTSAIQVCGKTSLGQLAALLESCDMVITNDGGPLHMAVALKKDVVAIYGPVDEKIYGPYPPNLRRITITSKHPCRPCYKNFKHIKCADVDCLKHIKPHEVIEAAESLIRKI